MESLGDNGVVDVASSYSLHETVERLKAMLTAKGTTLFAIIDHSGEAEKAGIKMPPTKLLIFGNPKSGTPLMLAAPSSALDLPLKMLVREEVSNGATQKIWISYNSPAFLAKRHGLPPELISNIAAIEGLAAQAAV